MTKLIIVIAALAISMSSFGLTLDSVKGQTLQKEQFKTLLGANKYSALLNQLTVEEKNKIAQVIVLNKADKKNLILLKDKNGKTFKQVNCGCPICC